MKIANWISGLFNKKQSAQPSLSSFLIDLDIKREKQKSVIRQEMEDIRVRNRINSEANGLLAEWLMAPEYDFGDGKKKMFIGLPKPTMYYLYDEESAKYKEKDIPSLIWERFEQIKKECE